MTDLAILTHEHNGFIIPQRKSDGYVSLTKMAAAYPNKKMNNFLRSESTNAYLEALSENTRISVFNLVQVVQGRNGGTWAHPEISIKFAAWLSPEFEVWAMQTLLRVMAGRQQPQSSTKQTDGPTTEQVLQMLQRVETGSVAEAVLAQKLADLVGVDMGQVSQVIAAQPAAQKTKAVRSGKAQSFAVSHQGNPRNHVQDFIAHEAYVKVTGDRKDFTSTADLFVAYQAYLRDYPLLPNSSETACESVCSLGKVLGTLLNEKATRKQTGNYKGRGYSGITLGELATVKP